MSAKNIYMKEKEPFHEKEYEELFKTASKAFKDQDFEQSYRSFRSIASGSGIETTKLAYDAKYFIAVQLKKGLGVHKNSKYTIDLFIEVSKSDSKYKEDVEVKNALDAAAKLNLAKDYENGQGVTKDIDNEFDKEFREYKSAKNTINNQDLDDDNNVLNSRIKYKLGLLYLSGVGCNQDIDNGYKKIVKAFMIIL
ncbi:6131_t:CDS:2 [Gigaspora margarita]|uniref:6131_t:CDS:1 n=1 Tax=Gigaspora margarita TaxID=4874 RepID=A0ABN7UWA8_GIGMA|nr:6131_t:CDS:2 [Gigaspora margarita]